MERDVASGLFVALSFSIALHLSVIYGVALGPSERVNAPVIMARLVPEALIPLAESRPIGVVRPRSSATASAFVPVAEEPVSTAVDDPAPPAPQLATVSARLDDSRLPRTDVPLLIDPVWYEARDLDLYPRPLTPVQPEYPPSAPGIVGEVTLLLQVDEFGLVNESSVVTAKPAGYFEEPALQAFQAARFAPAQREGHPVRSRIVVKVRFAPHSP